MPSKPLKRSLSDLLRTAPPAAPSTAERIAALDALGAKQLAAAALGEGRGDDEALRAAAVQRLPDGAALRALAGLEQGAAGNRPAPSPDLQRIAQARMAQLVDAGTVDLAELGAAAAGSSALLAVAALCADPSRLEQALASVQDPLRLAQLVVEGAPQRLRLLAAQRIEDPVQVNQLLRQLRGKDKSVYRILKQKSDATHAEAQRVAQHESDINSACAALEGLSRRVFDGLFAPALEHFEARWRGFESEAAPELRERARLAIERCRALIDQHAAEAAAQAALVAARTEQVARTAEAARQRDQAALLAAAEAEQARAAQAEARALEAQAREEQLAAAGRALIAKAQGALRAGHTGPAAGLRRAIEEKLAAAPPLPAQIARQVEKLDARLNELKQWKDYAVAPKRAELIAEMEALVGSTDPPQALAERIRELREQWKTISKGIVSDSQQDWERFNQAAASAYEPCRAYFEAQARQRRENVEQRRLVLERFRAFEAAQGDEHPDWRTIARVLREARLEWRRHAPVDRAALRPIEAEFDAALARLQARLDAWYAQNVADKQSLIRRAEELLTRDDSREAIEAVKTLQRQWRDVGPAPRAQEQALWHGFREHCDAVFRRRQQAYAEYTASLEAGKAQAVALCEQAEQLAAQAGPALLEGAAQLAQWRADFAALGELPRADERGLHARFERALKACQARLGAEREREAESAFTQLFEAARLIGMYGWALAQGAPPDEQAALRQAAESFIAGVPRWPKASTQALKDAWAKAAAASAAGSADHEAALRRLCIRAEIFSERATPPEDQALRREYQLQQLVQNMGRPQAAAPDELDQLALEWVRVGPVAPDRYQALLARFCQCRRRT
jgi:hypothetical protein